MIFGYVRVSSKDQNLDRQIDKIKKYCSDNNFSIEDRNIIKDIQTGSNFNRDGYQVLTKQILRTGDTLIISELDRLGRNKEMIKEELSILREIGVKVRILNIPTSLIELDEQNDWVMDMVNNILIEVLSAMAEEERTTIRRRQKEGIKAARDRGVELGRPRKDWDTLTKKQRDLFREIYPIWKDNGVTAVDFMKKVNLKRSTFYKIIDQYEEVLDGIREDI